MAEVMGDHMEGMDLEMIEWIKEIIETVLQGDMTLEMPHYHLATEIDHPLLAWKVKPLNYYSSVRNNGELALMLVYYLESKALLYP